MNRLKNSIISFCTAIVEIVRKLRLIFGVRPSPVAANSARFEVRDYFHTSSRPTFLRPGTGALRLVAASPRCVAMGLSLAGCGSFVTTAGPNLVAYANLTSHAGYMLLANPLSNAANRLDQIFFPAPVEGTELVKFDGKEWLTNEVVGGSWTIPGMTLSPGEAA